MLHNGTMDYGAIVKLCLCYKDEWMLSRTTAMTYKTTYYVHFSNITFYIVIQVLHFFFFVSFLGYKSFRLSILSKYQVSRTENMTCMISIFRIHV